MESGGSSKSQHKYNTRASKAGIETNTIIADDANDFINPQQQQQEQQSFKRDPDQYMPIANVIRIMRRILPAHAKIADDAKETIQECVSEFISFITSEANDRCHREYRKTITPEDVISAMATLGFDNYIQPVSIFLEKYRAQDPERSSMHHLPFVRRADGSVTAQMARARPRPPTPPPFTMGYVPAPPQAVGNYELPQMNHEYVFMGAAPGEGSSGGMEFDPFAPFNK